MSKFSNRGPKFIVSRVVSIASLCWLMLVAGSESAIADSIQPLARPQRGLTQRTPEQDLDTAPKAPLDMGNQASRAWKQAKVNNMRIGMSFLNQNKQQPGVKSFKSGVQYSVLAAGDGAKPKKGDVVEVNYSGRLADGTVFTNSNGKPTVLNLSQVVPGLAQAVKAMKVGAKWQIVVPPDQGYGDDGAPPTITPGAVLIYDVELLGIKPGKSKESPATSQAADQ